MYYITYYNYICNINVYIIYYIGTIVFNLNIHYFLYFTTSTQFKQVSKLRLFKYLVI